MGPRRLDRRPPGRNLCASLVRPTRLGPLQTMPRMHPPTTSETRPPTGNERPPADPSRRLKSAWRDPGFDVTTGWPTPRFWPPRLATPLATPIPAGKPLFLLGVANVANPPPVATPWSPHLTGRPKASDGGSFLSPSERALVVPLQSVSTRSGEPDGLGPRKVNHPHPQRDRLQACVCAGRSDRFGAPGPLGAPGPGVSWGQQHQRDDESG